jgi:ubiquinone/menaquinone biosynthesis C-methylase UbiE
VSIATTTNLHQPETFAAGYGSAYWESRALRFASQGSGLAAVCSYGMPEFYNRYIDVVQNRALAPWLQSSRGKRVLDVACGVGRWSRRLAHAGADVTGIDVSEMMITEATRRATAEGATCRFMVGDVTDFVLSSRFDRIFAVTVLQHLRTANGIDAALARLAGHLEPGGELVLLEVAPRRPVTRCDTSVFVARDRSFYEQAFRRAGLGCIDVRGVDPAPFKTWLLPAYRRMPVLVARTTLALVTAASLPIDMLLAQALTTCSWHKVFVLTHHERNGA